MRRLAHLGIRSLSMFNSQSSSYNPRKGIAPIDAGVVKMTPEEWQKAREDIKNEMQIKVAQYKEKHGNDIFNNIRPLAEEDTKGLKEQIEKSYHFSIYG